METLSWGLSTELYIQLYLSDDWKFINHHLCLVAVTNMELVSANRQDYSLSVREFYQKQTF